MNQYLMIWTTSTKNFIITAAIQFDATSIKARYGRWVVISKFLVHLLLPLSSNASAVKSSQSIESMFWEKKVAPAYSMCIARYVLLPQTCSRSQKWLCCDNKPAIKYKEFATFLLLDPHNMNNIFFSRAQGRKIWDFE